MKHICKIKLKELANVLTEEYGYLCFASFEERSVSVTKSLRNCKILKSICFYNTGNSSIDINAINADRIIAMTNNPEKIPVDLDKPMDTVEKMTHAIDEMVSVGITDLLVDISTFTHEALLILLYLLSNNRNFGTLYFLYNGASDYSVGDAPEQVWLSKGCQDVRNVIGYPGQINPARRTHAIILAGFEIERLTGLIEMLEPDYISIGDGIEPTNNRHENSMHYFSKKIDDWKSNFRSEKTDRFNFSCSDLIKTDNKICEIINRYPERNHILIPLNTKMSTLALGLVALRNPKVQVCYSIPELYNYKGYSNPSDNVTIINLMKFKPFCDF